MGLVIAGAAAFSASAPIVYGTQVLPTQLFDGTGVAIGTAANPIVSNVTVAGTTGTDYSANAAAVPIAGLVLLATVPATPSRAYVEVQNQSAGQIQLVRDDGAGANQSSVLLASGGANAQGGGWSSTTFKGRVRVYGVTGSQVSAFQD
jgi:hypothetical protein